MRYKVIGAILFLVSSLTLGMMGYSLYLVSPLNENRSVQAAAPPTVTPTPTVPPTATPSPEPTITPTPTLDLSACTVAGCAPGSTNTIANTMARTVGDLLWLQAPPQKLDCDDCPQNEQLSSAELEVLTAVDSQTLSLLRTVIASSQAHEIAPGIVYIVDNNTHHIVIDLQEPGYQLRNVLPNAERETLIAPSFCMSQDSLVITDADYYGLNGSNKTETGREVFFHPGWAALYKLNNQFDIDVLAEENYERVEISWGGGPIFVWDGAYRYNPKYEWFTEDNLIYYETTQTPAISAALSRNRKYLLLTVSSGLTLRQHAEQVISLGERWSIEIEKAIRFDGGSSTYLAIRLGDKMVPVLRPQEPKIANCFVVEKE